MSGLRSRDELERHALGCALVNPSHLGQLLAPETRELFWNLGHLRIYDAIARVHGRGSKVDLLTVRAEMETTGEL